MPLPNPFRRQSERPSLRERAAELKAGLSRAIRQPAPEPAAAAPEAAPGDSLEDFAGIEFDAYALDEPLKTPTAWATRFSNCAVAMHVADRTVRMTKPELIAFICEAGEKDPETPAAMFHALDSGQKSLEGWGNLLGLARARYIVAASAEFVGDTSAEPAHEINPSGTPAPDFADRVAEAGGTGDVLAASGIDHRDGTVSYVDAMGRVSRLPMAQWVAFNALQMHGRVQSEIGRRRTIEAGHLPMDQQTAWDAKIRRELCSDAVFALAFHPERAFQAEQDFRMGAEPASVPLPDFLAAAGIDLKTMPVRDLMALHDSGRLLGNVADAISCQPKGITNERLNGAGLMVDWLCDGLAGVVEAALKELRARTPSGPFDTNQRLATLAPAIIANGDPTETATFARELLAMVEP